MQDPPKALSAEQPPATLIEGSQVPPAPAVAVTDAIPNAIHERDRSAGKQSLLFGGLAAGLGLLGLLLFSEDKAALVLVDASLLLLGVGLAVEGVWLLSTRSRYGLLVDGIAIIVVGCPRREWLSRRQRHASAQGASLHGGVDWSHGCRVSRLHRCPERGAGVGDILFHTVMKR